MPTWVEGLDAYLAEGLEAEAVFDTLKNNLARGEKIKLSGFGNFLVKEKRSRRGRNPQTGGDLTISNRRVLTFKSSQALKNILNKTHHAISS